MIVEYIYSGQMSVGRNNMDSFLSAANHLQDLSMKTTLSNKRRRLDETLLAPDLPHIKTEESVNENAWTFYDRSYKTPISEKKKSKTEWKSSSLLESKSASRSHRVSDYPAAKVYPDYYEGMVGLDQEARIQVVVIHPET